MFYGNKSWGTEVAEQKKFLAEALAKEQPTEIFPASLPQERLWFLDQLRETNAAYNVHVGLWLKGKLNLPAIRASLQEIVNRHDSFRTTFQFARGKLFQVVSQHSSVNLVFDDVTGAGDPIARAYEIAFADVHAPFDLALGPLFRVRLIQVFPEDHVLLCTMHHIVTDSWSMQLFVKELSALYSAFCERKPSPLAELPIRYGDYAEWQREYFASSVVQHEIEYWKEKLRSAPPVLELPKDRARPAEQTFAGASQTVPLTEGVAKQVRSLAARHKATPFMVLLAAFKALLYRYSGQPDVLVGVPVAGRTRVETEALIGFCVNTLVLRDNLSGNPRFVEVLEQVRDTALGAFANADVPFEKIVELLQPERNLSYNPIFQVMFTSIKAAVQTRALGSLVAYPYVVSGKTSIFDVSATLIEASDGQWYMQFEYNTDLFSHERIGRMLADYIALVRVVAEQPEIRMLQVCVAGAEQNPVAESDSRRREVPAPSGAAIVASGTDENAAHNRKLLVRIWKEVLGIEKISVHDNFFDVGGHSLLAARLIREIEAATGRKLRVSAIFRAPTIDSFARLLTETSTPMVDPMVMELCRGTDKPSLFTVAIPGVESFGFGLLAHHLQGQYSVYKLQADAPVILDRPFPAEELRSLAEKYITAMRSAQPEGPYCLAAMCDGAVLAQAMIVALEAQGEQVSLLAIFDTWVLENSMRRPLWAVDYYCQRLRRFRNAPAQKRWEMIKSVIGRVFSRNLRQGGRGWKKAYWPDAGFQAPRFQAPVLLFKCPRQPYYYVRDPQMGWGKRTSGGVEVCTVRCGHMEMLRDPYVRLVADKIASRLMPRFENKLIVSMLGPRVDDGSSLVQQTVA